MNEAQIEVLAYSRDAIKCAGVCISEFNRISRVLAGEVWVALSSGLLRFPGLCLGLMLLCCYYRVSRSTLC